MIDKKEMENKQEIEEDKTKFIYFALKNCFKFEDVLSFMEHYENLKPFDVNLVNLQEFLKY